MFNINEEVLFQPDSNSKYRQVGRIIAISKNAVSVVTLGGAIFQVHLNRIFKIDKIPIRYKEKIHALLSL